MWLCGYAGASLPLRDLFDHDVKLGDEKQRRKQSRWVRKDGVRDDLLVRANESLLIDNGSASAAELLARSCANRKTRRRSPAIAARRGKMESLALPLRDRRGQRPPRSGDAEHHGRARVDSKSTDDSKPRAYRVTPDKLTPPSRGRPARQESWITVPPCCGLARWRQARSQRSWCAFRLNGSSSLMMKSFAVSYG